MCSRCQKANRPCDYALELPKQKPQLNVRFKACSLSPLVSSQRFASESERYAFDCFVQRSGQTLGISLGWPEWGRLVLQTSDQDPIIRHTLIGLGAIHDFRLRRAGLATAEGDLLRTSYSQYGKAIRQLQSRIQHQSAVETMLTCIVLTILDFMYGDDQAATAHLHAGVTVLRNFSSNTSLLSSEPVFRAEPLKVQKNHGASDLQKRFTTAFAFLDYWAARWINGEVFLPEITLIDGLAYDIAEDSDDAQTQIYHYDVLVGRTHEFLRASRVSFAGHTSIVSEVKDDLLGRIFYRLARLNTIGQRSLVDEDWRIVQVLRLNYDTLRIMLLACTSNGFQYQPFEHEFRNALALCSSLSTCDLIRPRCQPYSFSPGIIYPLYIAATCCCNVSICKQAISLLLSLQWTEGVWNSQTMATMAQRKLTERMQKL